MVRRSSGFDQKPKIRGALRFYKRKLESDRFYKIDLGKQFFSDFSKRSPQSTNKISNLNQMVKKELILTPLDVFKTHHLRSKN